LPKSITISPEDSQDHALKWSIPLLIVLGTPYLVLYWQALIPFNSFSLIKGTAILIGIIIGGTIIHEGLHGVTWALFARKKWDAIHFGIFWQALMPYCHCREPLKLIPYITGLAMPGLILGILPLIAGYLSGVSLIFLFGLYFTYSAISDFRIIMLLRHESATAWIKDHPEQIGWVVYSQQEMKQLEEE